MVMAKKIVFEIIADSDSTTPVSYTHLDVYKRQIQTESNNFLHTPLNCRGLKAYCFW